MEHCKYFSKHINTIRAYIDCLYQITEVYNGGLMHVMIDDRNIDDGTILWTLERCKIENEEDFCDLDRAECSEAKTSEEHTCEEFDEGEQNEVQQENDDQSI